MYTSVGDVLSLQPQIGSVTTITSAVVARFIGHADAIINAKLARLYSVPVAGDVPVLGVISADATVYRLLSLRMLNAEQNSKKPEWVNRYKESMDLLEAISKGDLPLVTSSGVEIAVGASGYGEATSNTISYDQTFNEGSMFESWVDDLKLYDLER
jgi:phage gp36-like protein